MLSDEKREEVPRVSRAASSWIQQPEGSEPGVIILSD